MTGANPDPKRPHSTPGPIPAWARTPARHAEPQSFDHLDDATLDRNLIECGMSPFMAQLTVEDRYTAGARWRIEQEMTA